MSSPETFRADIKKRCTCGHVAGEHVELTGRCLSFEVKAETGGWCGCRRFEGEK